MCWNVFVHTPTGVGYCGHAQKQNLVKQQKKGQRMHNPESQKCNLAYISKYNKISAHITFHLVKDCQ